MFKETVQSRLKKIDVYRKLPHELTEPTISGAVISLIALSCMAFLFITELVAYLQIDITSEMFVDIHRGDEMLVINMDISLPRVPCGLVSLDAQDIMGTHVVNVGGSLKKVNLTAEGQEVGAKIDMLRSGVQEDSNMIQKQLEEKQGCRVQGFIKVHKVPGNFHISSHAFHGNIHSLLGGNMARLDLSHHIHHLSFGLSQDIEKIKDKFEEGVTSPLDGLKRLRPDQVNEAQTYEYYIKVVPTTYKLLNGNEFNVHQFTASTNEFKSDGMPAIYFRYDLSPVTVRFAQERESIFHFLVQVCAIIGGVFTVAGLIDNVVHTSIAGILKKSREGKLG